MEGLLKKLLQLSELRELAEQIEQGQCPVLVTGLSPVHRAQAAAAAAHAADQ